MSDPGGILALGEHTFEMGDRIRSGSVPGVSGSDGMALSRRIEVLLDEGGYEALRRETAARDLRW
jgi:small-conductance mechanosensitive channel